MTQVLKRDEEDRLIAGVKNGDQEAYERLYQCYHGILFRQVSYRLQDAALAQDIVQETFLRTWVKRTRLTPGKPFLALLIKISKNMVQDHFKHQQVRSKHQEHVKQVTMPQAANPDADLKERLLREKIQEVVQRKLAHKCRTVFLLSRVEGFSNQEIADMMKTTKKTVENQLYHALKVLKKHCAGFL